MIDSEMRYKGRYTKHFLKDVKVIKTDKILLDRLNKKIEKILEYPEHLVIHLKLVVLCLPATAGMDRLPLHLFPGCYRNPNSRMLLVVPFVQLFSALLFSL